MIGNRDRISAEASHTASKGTPWTAGQNLAVMLGLLTAAFQAHVASGQVPEEPGDSATILESSLADSPLCSEPIEPGWHPGGRVGGRLGGLFGPPADRHRGVGQPLVGESWRYRPLSAGWFMGMAWGGPLVDDWVSGNQGFFGGYRLGWDYDHYWGLEMRAAFGNVALYDSQRAKDAQRAADDQKGIAPDDPFRNRFEPRRDATAGFWDVSLLYYPWGDATWRPYLMAGLGTASVDFIDRLSTRYHETVFAMPVAIGVKYRHSPWMALRLELADNLAFGDTFDTAHFVSLTGGVEVRFGGSRVAYWPWHPGRHYW